MTENKRVYSTACMMSRRPPYRTDEPEFYRCAICGGIVIKNRPAGAGTASVSEAGVCCGHRLTRLEAQAPDEAHAMRFCIFGGFEHNTVRVEVQEGWHPMDSDHAIEWMYLHTFQGGQLKYLPLKEASAPPALGQDILPVLESVGYTEDEIKAMSAAGECGPLQ